MCTNERFKSRRFFGIKTFVQQVLTQIETKIKEPKPKTKNKPSQTIMGKPKTKSKNQNQETKTHQNRQNPLQNKGFRDIQGCGSQITKSAIQNNAKSITKHTEFKTKKTATK